MYKGSLAKAWSSLLDNRVPSAIYTKIFNNGKSSLSIIGSGFILRSGLCMAGFKTFVCEREAEILAMFVTIMGVSFIP